jgi:hypothetical protein
MTLAVKWSEKGVKEGDSPGGLSYGWKGGATATKRISVQWADRFTACRQAVGYSYPLYSGGVHYLRREPPEPYHPADTTLFCSQCHLVGGQRWLGRSAHDRTTYALVPGYPKADVNPDPQGDTLWKNNEFDLALLEMQFTAADFYIRSDSDIDTTYAGSELSRFTSYRESRQVKGLILQGGTMSWILETGDPGAPTAESIPYGVPRLQFTKTVFVKWLQVAIAAVPWNTIDGMIGKINKVPFMGYPEDTLLMVAPTTDRYVMANGQIGCDVEFCYEFTPHLQPKLLYSKAGAFIDYRWVTTQTGSVTPPTPGSLPDGQFLFNEDDFYKCYVPNNG